MSIIPGGVRLGGFIAPNDSGDTYAVFKPIYGLGGLRTVDTLLDRDAITTPRREQGMMVYVKEDLNYYQLGSGLTNSEWVNLNLTNAGTSYGSQITVDAAGTNSYSGTATPSITGYSTSTIYLTQFANTNTLTATTLDIDGYGPLDLLKGTEDGLGPLEINEIQTGVTYFLTYDGTQFQFFTSSPEGTPGTYTNLNPATATVGGVVAGTTFSAATWQSIFDTMFYPTLTPNFTSFVMRATPSTGSTQATTLEVGNSVSGGTRVFTWGTSNPSFIKPGTIKIYNVTGGNTIISTPSSGITNDGNEVIGGLANVQKTTPTSHIWRIYGTRTNNSTFNLSFQVNWYWRRMYGVSSATTITTSAGVNAFSGTGSLTTTIAGTYSFVGPGYKYFFVPTSFGAPSLFRDQSTQLAVAMADVTDNPFFSGVSGSYYYGTTSVTNSFGITTNYRVYRTRNFLNGNITITVS
jgi:hypothetical protein